MMNIYIREIYKHLTRAPIDDVIKELGIQPTLFGIFASRLQARTNTETRILLQKYKAWKEQ